MEVIKIPSHKTLQQAAEWFATLSDESVTDQQKSAWARWLNQHSQHRQAWLYVENVGQRFHRATQIGDLHDVSHTLTAARTAQLTRRKTLQGLGALCVMGLSWRFTPLPKFTQNYTMAWRADHHTATGETRELALQDGGQLWLNTASAININYQASKRQIVLLAGEILIQTAADSQSRPFFVNTSQGTLQALGTRFTVREQGETTLLVVYEGAVKIQTTSGKTQIINAGQQTYLSQHHIQPYVTAEAAREAWTRGLIVANNISLKSLIAEVNRYQNGHITINPAIENLRVMGTYPTNQPDHVLAMLESALPIKVQRILPWWVALQPSE